MSDSAGTEPVGRHWIVILEPRRSSPLRGLVRRRVRGAPPGTGLVPGDYVWVETAHITEGKEMSLVDSCRIST